MTHPAAAVQRLGDLLSSSMRQLNIPFCVEDERVGFIVPESSNSSSNETLCRGRQNAYQISPYGNYLTLYLEARKMERLLNTQCHVARLRLSQRGQQNLTRSIIFDINLMDTFLPDCLRPQIASISGVLAKSAGSGPFFPLHCQCGSLKAGLYFFDVCLIFWYLHTWQIFQ